MKAQTQRRLRQIHQYVGLFFAPAILFFAATGLLQTIGLQEGPGAPKWIAAVAGLHKHQAFPKPRPARAPGDRPRPPREQPADDYSAIPLKGFVLMLSIGLFASTVLGIVISLVSRAMRRGSTIALVAGLVVPVLLMML